MKNILLFLLISLVLISCTAEKAEKEKNLDKQMDAPVKVKPINLPRNKQAGEF